MIKRVFLAVSATALLLAGGCATAVPITSTFNAAEVEWANATGDNTITGSAVIRTRGGEARTCAASEVQLVPESTYARERMAALYGSSERGYNRLFMGRRVQNPAGDPSYVRHSRTEHCDGQGQFVFSNLPDGTYFVIAQVVWEVAGSYAPEGGYLMQRVAVRGGESRRIVLSP